MKSKIGFALLLVFTVAIAIFASANLSALTGTPAQSGEVTEIPLETETPASTSTPELEPSPTPSPAPPTLNLTELRMITDKLGWATGWIEENGTLRFMSALRTEDGGAHWRDVSPETPEGSMTVSHFWGEGYGYGASAGVAVIPPGNSQVIIWRTYDGGQSWTQYKPLEMQTKGPGQLFFFRYGWNVWYMAEIDEAEATYPIMLFFSEYDGGDWYPATAPEFDSAQYDLLPPECRKENVYFLMDKIGWITGSCPNHKFLFYKGNMWGDWREELLAPPDNAPDLFANSECHIQPPTFFAREPDRSYITSNGWLVVLCAQTAPVIYQTDNDGYSWSYAATQWPLLDFSIHRYNFTILDFDGNERWFHSFNDEFSDERFFITHNGGQTWNEVPLTISLSDANLQFVTNQTGWALSQPSDGRSLLSQTIDGGQIWARLNPQLLP